MRMSRRGKMLLIIVEKPRSRECWSIGSLMTKDAPQKPDHALPRRSHSCQAIWAWSWCYICRTVLSGVSETWTLRKVKTTRELWYVVLDKNRKVKWKDNVSYEDALRRVDENKCILTTILRTKAYYTVSSRRFEGNLTSWKKNQGDWWFEADKTRLVVERDRRRAKFADQV